MTAVPTTSPITIDGALDEEVWQRAAPAADFIQADPLEGQPATEITEVRIAYDADYLYIARALPRHRSPSGIVVNEIRKDFAGRDQDTFEVLLDTFADRRNGFVFSTNSAGREGRHASRQRGPRRQHQLGRGVVGRSAQDRGRLDRGVPHPVQDAAIRSRRRQDLGHQLRAARPPQERDQLLVAGVARLFDLIAHRRPARSPACRRCARAATCASSRFSRPGAVRGVGEARIRSRCHARASTSRPASRRR